MNSITVRSFAKINWMLRVLERRADGYHDLETIFQTVSLHDVITLTRAPRLELTCDDPSVPVDGTNLVWRAAATMMDRFGVDPVRIELRKAIPPGGGLGGGSSNAAMTLLALDRMFDLETSPERLLEMAAELGSDVPFFLVGGTAWGSGRGERLRILPSPASVPLLLLIPEERVATAEAYRLLAEAREKGDLRVPRPYRVERAEWVLREGVVDHGAELVNDFEGVVFGAHPRLRVLKEALFDAGAGFALMSGSGSALLGAFRDEAVRDSAAPAFGTDVRAVPCELVTAHEAMRDLR
ncbi:MAG TPA: 4-(cytidine 5'-diphospho)-2-C-methyl-D-erythritol kinase [Thermoanaerobaculia bacterium]|nr:4-(cytidine 5'-diphospho)-2-C-methyl-D-erythritol kinase [Thermoanaerobaculia bacterium]